MEEPKQQKCIDCVAEDDLEFKPICCPFPKHCPYSIEFEEGD
ncbi:MAG: hypothetical protein WC877_01200 [Dehalococcoidales bacterium]|jgi:hypothetical protein